LVRFFYEKFIPLIAKFSTTVMPTVKEQFVTVFPFQKTTEFQQ